MKQNNLFRGRGMKQLKRLLVILVSIVFFLSGSLNILAASKPLYAWLKNISHANYGKCETVTIFFDAYRDINSFTLKSPDRIVIDVKYSLLEGRPQTIKGGDLVETIRYAQYEKNVVRIVLDTRGAQNYKIEQVDNLIKVYVGDLSELSKDQEQNDRQQLDREKDQISRGGLASRGENTRVIKNPISKNLVYKNEGDRVYLSMQGATLTKGGENYQKFFTEKYSEDGLTYTLSFKSTYAKLDKGTIEIDDGYLESITIDKTVLPLRTNITFKAKDKFVYHVMARPQIDDTAITILKPASEDEKLVVIDPGHGGYEPGAIYKNLIEKNINLDIALKLNELLRENNVNTYIIREDDSYVGIYERAYIANKLNASLFLSIHNNALNDTSYDGTMTLYSINAKESKKFNSLEFANILQKGLVNDIDTKDRLVRERNDLVVLRLTEMPSALVEVAFLTNASDRAKLQNEEFKQKAAQSICNSIMKSLQKVE